MVLVLQLDDDGNPSNGLNGSLLGATASTRMDLSSRRIGAGLHGRTERSTPATTGGGNGDGGDAADYSPGIHPPPAYSSLPLAAPTHLRHHHHEQQQQTMGLKLDQTWSVAPRAAEGRPVSVGSPHGELLPRFSELMISDRQSAKPSERGRRADDDGEVSITQATILASLLHAYPVVISLVCHLDQTDISSLAQTCRQVRSGLLQFRGQVLAHTLRCVRESTPRDRTSLAPSRWCPPCARDLVAPCRRCGQTVCRNCTAKPADILRTTQRHRRLCRTCQTGPLDLLGLDLCSEPPPGAVSAPRPGRGGGPCICASTGVHICRGCDGSQNGADMTYTRVWSWRSRYRNLGFGLGTGVGEGSAGVKCGRGPSCLAARDLIVDMDCAEVLRTVRSRGFGGSNATQGEVATTFLIGGGGIGTGHVEGNVEDTPPTPSTPLTPMLVDSGILDAAGSGIGSASSSGRMSTAAAAAAAAAAATAAAETQQMADGQTASQLARVNPASAAAEADTNAQGDKHESAGYYRQEIEGIGGVVKKKLKKRVRVGATVAEYEDESQTGAFLERERTGAMRSWCAWCDRVIPSLADAEMLKRVKKGSQLRDAH